MRRIFAMANTQVPASSVHSLTLDCGLSLFDGHSLSFFALLLIHIQNVEIYRRGIDMSPLVRHICWEYEVRIVQVNTVGCRCDPCAISLQALTYQARHRLRAPTIRGFNAKTVLPALRHLSCRRLECLVLGDVSISSTSSYIIEGTLTKQHISHFTLLPVSPETGV